MKKQFAQQGNALVAKNNQISCLTNTFILEHGYSLRISVVQNLHVQRSTFIQASAKKLAELF